MLLSAVLLYSCLIEVLRLSPAQWGGLDETAMADKKGKTKTDPAVAVKPMSSMSTIRAAMGRPPIENLLSGGVPLTEDERNLLEYYVNDVVRELLADKSIVSNPPQRAQTVVV